MVDAKEINIVTFNEVIALPVKYHVIDRLSIIAMTRYKIAFETTLNSMNILSINYVSFSHREKLII